MKMIEICKRNALLFSEKVCGMLSLNGDPFPEYFDCSDHIATSGTQDYLYHLNKTVLEIDYLVNIFKLHFQSKDFKLWEKEWYNQTLSAAWVHDIGMIEPRKEHGIISAETIFSKNGHGFDFEGINSEDRSKIGILCIRHNSGWTKAFRAMKEIHIKYGLSSDILEEWFEDEDTPKWDLDFAGKLISTADSLRCRGKNLRNDFKQPFSLWAECLVCKTVYNKPRDFCSETNCDSSRLDPKVVISA